MKKNILINIYLLLICLNAFGETTNSIKVDSFSQNSIQHNISNLNYKVDSLIKIQRNDNKEKIEIDEIQKAIHNLNLQINELQKQNKALSDSLSYLINADTSKLDEFEYNYKLYKNEEKLNNKLFSTIRWVLRVSLLLLLALIGLNFWFNLRLGKKEIEALKNEISNITDDKLSNHTIDINNIKNKISNITDEKLSKHTEDIKNSLSDKVSKSNFHVKTGILEGMILDTKTDLLLKNGHILKTQNKPEEALMSYINAGVICNKSNHFLLSSVLGHLIIVLNDLDEMHNYRYEELLKFSKELSDKYSEQKLLITGKLKLIKKFEYRNSEFTQFKLPIIPYSGNDKVYID